MWILAAIASAVFDGLSTVFDKGGLKHTDPIVGNAVRSIFVLLVSTVIVLFIGSISELRTVPLKDMFYIVLSGLCTGLCCLFYYKALSIGNINKVIPIYKSSALITILLAMIIFHEDNNMTLKVVSTFLIGIGIFLLIDNDNPEKSKSLKWLIFALLSAIAGGVMSIFAKMGMNNIESNLGVTIRNLVIVIIAWMSVVTNNKGKELKQLQKHEMFCLAVSGTLWGFSNVFYYYAAKVGILSVVVPIDRMSVLISVAFGILIYKEKMTFRSTTGLIVMILGTLLIAICG
jgi:transporter family protein